LAKSQLFDGLNRLFPEGGHFLMRAVRDSLHKIDNHDLKQQTRVFLVKKLSMQ
jgi:predicted metal-dependent hydrolase